MEQRRVVRDMDAGKAPLHVRFTAEGDAWIADARANEAVVVRAGSTQVNARHQVGDYPIEVTFTPDGAEAWVPNAVSNNVTVLDVATGRRMADIAVGANPLHVAFSPDGALAYVSVRDEGAVATVDVRTREVLRKVPVGARPDGFITGTRYAVAAR